MERVRVFVRSTFQSLQIRNYRLFATGQLISLIFGWVQITAQDWLVLELSHGSASALGVVTALQFAPMLLFTLYAGKLADRFDKRYLLIVANLLWFVLAALMGALVVSGAVLLWQVYVFAALWGVVTAVETPVRQSFVSELVGKPLLPNAMSLNAATFNTARILGPALAGLTIAALGTGTAFVVNAASYVFPVASAITRWRQEGACTRSAERSVRTSRPGGTPRRSARPRRSRGRCRRGKGGGACGRRRSLAIPRRTTGARLPSEPPPRPRPLPSARSNRGPAPATR